MLLKSDVRSLTTIPMQNRVLTFFSGFLLTFVLCFGLAGTIQAEDVEIEVVVPAICGNGVIEGAESCDTNEFGAETCATQGFAGGGNLSCTGACTINTNNCEEGGGGGAAPPPPPPPPPQPVCGNGQIEQGEQCDAGNIQNGDGCSAVCQIEAEDAAVCGNAIIEGQEQCDDGNNQNGDGCSANCAIENPVCGNARVEQGEQCDDGNNQNGDGCSAACVIEVNPVCGNGQVEDGEQCDDGNQAAGDGCSALCQVEEPNEPEDPEQQDPDQPDDQIVNPQDPPVVENNDNQNNPPGENNNGAEPNAQAIPEDALLRWVANRSIVVQAPQITRVSGDIFTFEVKVDSFPQGSIQKGTAVYNGNTQAFAFNQANEYFIADFRAANQTQDISLRVELNDGTLFTSTKTITIVPPGRTNSDGEILPEVEVLLLNMDEGGGIFPAVRYGQQNPQYSNASGNYVFVVPNGNYAIVAKKDGYSERRTFSFVVSNNVVNRSIHLVELVPSLEEELKALPENANTAEKAAVVAKNVGEKTVAQTKKIIQRGTEVAKKITF